MVALLAFVLLQHLVGVSPLECFDCVWFDADMLPAIGQPSLEQFTNNTECFYGVNAATKETDDGFCYTATATFFGMPFSVIRKSTSRSGFDAMRESLRQVGVVFPLDFPARTCKKRNFGSGKLEDLIMESCGCFTDLCNGAESAEERQPERPPNVRSLKSSDKLVGLPVSIVGVGAPVGGERGPAPDATDAPATEPTGGAMNDTTGDTTAVTGGDEATTESTTTKRKPTTTTTTTTTPPPTTTTTTAPPTTTTTTMTTTSTTPGTPPSTSTAASTARSSNSTTAATVKSYLKSAASDRRSTLLPAFLLLLAASLMP